MSLDGFGHGRAVGVAGHADEASQLLLFSLEQTFQGAIGSLYFCQVVVKTQAVDVYQVNVVHVEALEADFQVAHEAIAGSLLNFGGQKDSLAPRLQNLSDAPLAFASGTAVRVGRIDIGDPQIEGAVKRRQ